MIREKKFPFEFVLRDCNNKLVRDNKIGQRKLVGIYVGGTCWLLYRLPVEGCLPEDFLSSINSITECKYRFPTAEDYKILDDEKLFKQLKDVVEELINNHFTASRFSKEEYADLSDYLEKFITRCKRIRLVLEDSI